MGVLDIRDDHPDRVDPLEPQVASQHVAAIAQGHHGRLHPGTQILADAAIAVERP